MIGWRMQPSTASVLGVIAVVSVMITVTASEVEKDGVIERGINHLASGEEDRRFPDSERAAANETADGNDVVALAGEDANESVTAGGLVELVSAPRKYTVATTVPEPKDAQVDSATRQDDRNETASNIYVGDELQRDQSDVRPVAQGALDDDPRDPRRTIDGSGLRSSDEDDRNTTPGSLEDFPVSVLSYEESSTRLAVVEHRMMLSSGIVGQDLPTGESSKLGGQKNQSRSTTTEEAFVIATEVIEKKGVDDIKSISFQVPSNGHEHDDRDDEERQQVGKGIIKGDGRKDPSRSANNALVGGSKSTKAFYEIKPSIKTEMERNIDGQQPSTTTPQRIVLPGRRFVLPSVDSAFGKFGPYFEDGDQEMNITARIGSTVLLDCKIGMLGDKKVTWLQHNKESFRLLTVGRIPYSVDQRISLNFRYPSNWRLQILYASPRDSGLYKCQVATHPPLVKKINVIVTAPQLTITDDAGRIVPKERHLKAGSALRLRCEARDVLESQNESVVWTRGDETLTEDVSENRTTEISASEEVLVIVSTLIVERASPRHAGNYSCLVPGKARTTIAVHVLNGELPAAVHDGNGVSRAVLNLWLIHLTMSYVFSR